MDAIALALALPSEGFEFAADGDSTRWSNAGGWMTPEAVWQVAAAKTEVTGFLNRKPRHNLPLAGGQRITELPADMRRLLVC